MLTHLTASNLKGCTFQHELSPCTLFIGQNWSGKSARATAARILFLGHDPELGKQASATFDLASGPKMEITGLFNGARIERSFKQGKDSVRASSVVPEDFPEVPSILFNPSEYFSLSTNRAVQYVLEHGGLGQSTKTLDELVPKLRTLHPEPFTDEHTGAVSAFVGWLEAHLPKHAKKPLTEALASIAEEIDEELKSIRSTIKRLTETTNQMAAAEEQPVRPIPLIEDDTLAKRTERDTVLAEIQRLTNQIDQGTLTNNRIAELKALLLDTVQPGEIKEHQTKVEILRKALVTAKAECKADESSELLHQAEIDLEKMTGELARLNDRQTALLKAAETLSVTRRSLGQQLTALTDKAVRPLALIQTELDELTALQKAFRPESEALQSRLLVVESNLDHQRARIRELETKQAEIRTDYERVARLPHCPTCLAETPGWLEKLHVKHLNELANSKSAIDQTTRATKALEDEMVKLRKELEGAHTRDGQTRARFDRIGPLTTEREESLYITREITRLRAELERLDGQSTPAGESETLAKAIVAQQDIHAACGVRANTLRERHQAELRNLKQVESIQNEINFNETLLHNLQNKAQKHASYQGELSSLAEVDVATLDTSRGGRNQILIGLDAQIAQLEQEKSDAIGQADRTAARDKVLTELRSARADKDVYDMAKDAVIEYRNEIVAAGVRPLLTVANQFLRGIMRSEIAYQDDQLGRMEDGKFVKSCTFSCGEKQLLFLAFAVALAHSSPFKLLILDEMGNFHPVTKMKVLSRMIELQRSAVINQFIGVEPSSDAPVLDGLTVIEV